MVADCSIDLIARWDGSSWIASVRGMVIDSVGLDAFSSDLREKAAPLRLGCVMGAHGRVTAARDMANAVTRLRSSPKK